MRIEYRVSVPGGPPRSFVVHLDAESRMVHEDPRNFPEWTSLKEWKCPHCSLDTVLDRYCPAATSIAPLVAAFGDSVSYEKVAVEVITPTRTISAHASLQDTLSSLMGLCMATSGCPTMNLFKPMARYHLPFASEEETQYRVMCMYLLAQFFVQRKRGIPDWEARRLPQIYDAVRVVNKYMAKRLAAAASMDANANALVNLDCFATTVAFTLRQELFAELERIFEAYLP